MIDKAYQYHIGHRTALDIISETATAIWEELSKEYLQPPTREKWRAIQQEFWTKWNFPMAVGATDGMHVQIRVSVIN